MLQMAVAKELGHTLSELTQRVTLEELIIWSVYFDLYNEEQEAAMKKVRRR